VGDHVAARLLVDAAVDEAADRVAGRRERLADAQHVVPEIGDAPADVARAQALEVVVELVDLVVEIVDELEVPLCDRVEEHAVRHAGGSPGRHASCTGSGRTARRPAASCGR
jgi:hypothetical protein